jgi:hypothetical protein
MSGLYTSSGSTGHAPNQISEFGNHRFFHRAQQPRGYVGVRNERN